MSNYIFPPRIVAGTLYRTSDDAEYVEGKILQTLAIVRGELVSDPFFGVPFRLFSSTTDINADAARLEIILSQEIPEADFSVSATILEDGLISMQVLWTYSGTEFTNQFDVQI